MKEDEGKQEDKFDFTSDGEGLGYISLDRARVRAMQEARNTPGDYGEAFRGKRMVFEAIEDDENEDYYIIVLSFRPAGEFEGRPGREQFFIEKEGVVAIRQVLSFPHSGNRGRAGLIFTTLGLGSITVVVIVTILLAVNGDDSDLPVLANIDSTKSPQESGGLVLETPESAQITTPVLDVGPTQFPVKSTPMPKSTLAPPSTIASIVSTSTPTLLTRPTPGPFATAVTRRTPVITKTPDQSTITIGVKGDSLQFDTNQISVESGEEITITLANSSGVNTHNLVIVQDGTKDAVAANGTAAGPANNWVIPGDARVIANTVLLGPVDSGEVTFTAPAPGTYQFVCTFPGHNFTMFGDFIVH